GSGSATGVAEAALAATKHLWLGVTIFFVISGYCISATVDVTRRQSQSLRTYFSRRFRRIFPTFLIFLSLSALLVGLVDCTVFPGVFSKTSHPIARPWSLTFQQWIGNLTLTESWLPRVLGTEQRYFMGTAWTLCYEEQFYAVTGLLLLLARRRFF